jgi:hypothetical protein
MWKWDGTCFVGFTSFQSAVLFSIETAFTIGWGGWGGGGGGREGL